MVEAENNPPTILVVLGATGDLMSRKIAPAIYHLLEEDVLPEKFAVVGFSREKLNDDSFRLHINKALDAHEDIKVVDRFRKPCLDLFFIYWRRSYRSFRVYRTS